MNQSVSFCALHSEFYSNDCPYCLSNDRDFNDDAEGHRSYDWDKLWDEIMPDSLGG